MKRSNLDTLRVLFKLLSMGESLCYSLVKSMRVSEPDSSVVRAVFMGHHPRKVIGLFKAETKEQKLLIAMVKNARISDTVLVGRHGSRLLTTFERWERMRESRKGISKVMAFRGYIISSILGCVLAVVSGIAPVVLSFSLNGQLRIDPFPIELFSLAMGLTSSITIGLFFGTRRFYVNPLLTFFLFILVYSSFSSIANLGSYGGLLNK